MHKTIEGVNWTVSEVIKFTSASAFVNYCMAEKAIYGNFKPERKEQALKLVYSLCVPDVPQAEVTPEPEVIADGIEPVITAVEPEQPEPKSKRLNKKQLPEPQDEFNIGM